MYWLNEGYIVKNENVSQLKKEDNKSIDNLQFIFKINDISRFQC